MCVVHTGTNIVLKKYEYKYLKKFILKVNKKFTKNKEDVVATPFLNELDPVKRATKKYNL